MTDVLLEDLDGGVATLTLNRPDRLNALSPEMLDAFREALPRLDADPDVGAIVITGAGRGFCAGGDVKAMAGRAAPGSEARYEHIRRAHQIPRLLRGMRTVVIAAVNGPAFGAGLGFAMACDLRVAARSATFGTAFASVGLSGDWGGSWTLTRLVGPARAREMYLTGEKLDADAALRIGLVNRVVEDETLAAETKALARRFAEGPRVAYGYMKRNLFAAETQSFDAVLEMEAVHQVRSEGTADHAEAAKAFVEKRRPVFRGR